MKVLDNSAKRINRADLLRALENKDDGLLSITAEMCGFKEPPKKNIQSDVGELLQAFTSLSNDKQVAISNILSIEEESDQKNELKNIVNQPHFYRVIERKPSELLPESPEGEIQPQPPEFFEHTGSFDPESVIPLAVPPPNKEPLVAWARLWPVLRRLLSEVKRSNQPDVPRLVWMMAKGELLQQIPRKTRQRWTARVQIMVDRPERTCLFNQDYNQLLKQLKQLRGVTGLEFLKILRQPGGRVQVERGGSKQREMCEWGVPEAGTTVFILSDLGLLDDSGMTLRCWLQVGKQLRLAGCQPVVLLPLPERYLLPELIALFNCISWDRSSSLQAVHYVAPQNDGQASSYEEDTLPAEDLLAWLSPAVRVEPALLRAVRHQLPIQEVDVGNEVAAWHHADVVRSSVGFHFQPDKVVIGKYQRRFEELAEEQPERARVITRLIRGYHSHIFPTFHHEELLTLARLLGEENLDSREREEVPLAREHMCELVKAALGKEQMRAARSFLWDQIERQPEAMLPNNDFYQAVWGWKQGALGISEELEIPEGCDPRNVLAFMEGKKQERREYVLFQQGHRELQLGTRNRYEDGQDDFAVGSELAAFKTASRVMLSQHTGADGKQRQMLLPLSDLDTETFALEEQELQRLHIAGEEVTLERFVKPEWAVGIGQNREGVFAESQNDEGEVYRWWWHPPEWNNQEGIQRGFWYPSAVLPHTEVDGYLYGRDKYGFYCKIRLIETSSHPENDQAQCFRWIEPTTFLMGSPTNEKGRNIDELETAMTLHEGYWLADTTVTQLLWLTVLEDYPSRFNGHYHPVESISYDDVERFLETVWNNWKINWKLPTEMEWENACRAGTKGAFNFEGEISFEALNYSGKWHQSGWGDNALRKTVEVDAYPPNRWGLYQMHGNVLEWCDNYYSYAYGDSFWRKDRFRRILRGGSWIHDGKSSRSACRHAHSPNHVSASIGFRLARSHEAKPIRTITSPKKSDQ